MLLSAHGKPVSQSVEFTHRSPVWFNVMRCYCCSESSYADCCEPFIKGDRFPVLPEQLMRSRFSAYCVGNYRYISETYSRSVRLNLDEISLAEEAKNNCWFALQIIPQSHADKVEFKAYYFYQGQPHLLHETSGFAKESGRWVYTDGELHNDFGKITIGRNDICPCSSGKKFKQCCLQKAGR